jgi:hypothetical protein
VNAFALAVGCLVGNRFSRIKLRAQTFVPSALRLAIRS